MTGTRSACTWPPGERAGRTLEDREVLVFHLRDGKVVEVWQYLENQYTLRRVLLLVVAAEPTPLLDSPVFAVVVMDASAHLPRYGDQFPFPFCIMSCTFSRMAASDAASSSCGLNITSSVPATAAGTCPGGM
jgi:archaeosine-15-forming tRNA-guanine transglycosylase